MLFGLLLVHYGASKTANYMDIRQIPLEAKHQQSLTWATAVYNDTLDDDDSHILHHMPVANMIKNWTKQHLDTYLTMAEMACL
jgi:arginine deiminase